MLGGYLVLWWLCEIRNECWNLVYDAPTTSFVDVLCCAWYLPHLVKHGTTSKTDHHHEACWSISKRDKFNALEIETQNQIVSKLFSSCYVKSRRSSGLSESYARDNAKTLYLSTRSLMFTRQPSPSSLSFSKTSTTWPHRVWSTLCPQRHKKQVQRLQEDTLVCSVSNAKSNATGRSHVQTASKPEQNAS